MGTSNMLGDNLVCNFGAGWQRGVIETSTPYIPFSSENIKAEIGLHVGLRGVNITLKGKESSLLFYNAGLPEHQLNNTINYNEEFRWEGTRGTGLGYGPFGSISFVY